MPARPYILPDGPAQIAFSGGRTSAYMLRHIQIANDGLDPDRVAVIFTNTGRERPETLDFVAECGARWGVPIIWAEYRAGAPGFEIVGHNSAARAGEPFKALVHKRRYLPNQHQRFCTQELKVRVAAKVCRDLAWDRWTTAVGIRADEAHRLATQPRERWTNWRPLVAAGVTKSGVSDWWRRQSFDLRLPSINGKTPGGNCDGCFLKSEAALAALARDEPERHAWWEQMEADVSALTRGDGGRWSSRYSRRELRLAVERQGDWLFADDARLCQASDGECV